MSGQATFEIVASHLAAYLPPGAVEAECTIPVEEIQGWLRDDGASPLPPEARERSWWDALRRRHDYAALPDAGWRVERIDWEGAGITFNWSDRRDDAGVGERPGSPAPAADR
jgi:hypothetical protein